MTVLSKKIDDVPDIRHVVNKKYLFKKFSQNHLIINQKHQNLPDISGYR